jgi:hypothetical protein
VQAWQVQQAELQSRLSESASAIAKASGGIMQAMSAFEATQQRSTHMLAALLGNARTWDDLLFYGAGAVLIVVLAWHPATAQARLPMCIALAACLLVQRAFIAAATRWQWVRHPDSPQSQPPGCH